MPFKVVPRFNKSFAAHNINSPGEASAIFLRVSRARGFLWPRLDSAPASRQSFIFISITQQTQRFVRRLKIVCQVIGILMISITKMLLIASKVVYARSLCVGPESEKHRCESLNEAIKCWMLAQHFTPLDQKSFSNLSKPINSHSRETLFAI